MNIIAGKKKHAANYNKTTKRLNPLLAFTFSFSIYNLLGLIDLPWNISNSYKKGAAWSMFILAILALTTIYLLFSARKGPNFENKIIRSSHSLLGTLLLGIFGSCLALSVISNRGIPLFLGEARFSNSAILFNLAQMYGLWILLSTINQIEIGNRIKKAPIALYLIGVTSFGYRTPALVFGLIITIYIVLYKFPLGKSIKVGAVCGASFIAISAIFSGYRVSQDYDVQSFFKNIDFEYISEHSYISPLVPALAMFDYSQLTVSDIAENLKTPMAGRLFLSNYETFLPGRHWGARNIVGDIVGARWVSDRPMSITPTLQGALYIDFGHWGVFLGFLIIGFTITMLYRASLTGTSRTRFIFSYIFAMFIMSIHNGYWDVSFVFFLFFLILIKIFDILALTFPKRTTAHSSIPLLNNIYRTK